MHSMPLEITNFFLAMQAGPSGLRMLQDMFAPDAEYSEPFSGQSAPHKGPAAIIAAFEASRTADFDDSVIHLGAVNVQGEVITVDWTCYSRAIPGGQGSGSNVFVIRDGKIASLTTTLKMDGQP
ncbi:nuclear transport factor 2 family protein [Yoonia sp. SS1-5]|uniref:Nuclear transport factor 2 family protein n=1 Tax=Yoonia rhodophyticola TaxID=3137370 RepID=A0AAN0ME25_9RHOB